MSVPGVVLSWFPVLFLISQKDGTVDLFPSAIFSFPRDESLICSWWGSYRDSVEG